MIRTTIRTMVYLPNELHRGLKHLAVERGTSLAKLVREALEIFYREDIADLRVARKRLQEYLKHPARAIPYRAHGAKRLKR